MKGIYYIKDKKSRIYVGSSKDIEKRLERHFNDLRKGTHHNVYLQRIFNKHGPDFFETGILEETDFLFERESYYISQIGTLNIGSVGGGDNISNHPDKKDIIQRIKETLRRKYAAGEIVLPSHEGSKNGNWKGGKFGENWHKCLKCDERIYQTKTYCGKCRPRHGKDNPFYGKTHSEETRQILSDKAKGRRPGNAKRLLADGVIYDTARIAAKELGISPALVTYRVKSDKWDYQYV